MLMVTQLWPADLRDTESAKKTQTPVADLISVPFQNSFNLGAGTDHDQTIYIPI